MIKLAQFLQSSNDTLGRAVSWLTILMVCLTFLVVLLRYFFDIGWIAMQELVLYLHATLFMVGASFTLKQDEHVRVDIFYRRFSPKTQALVNLAGTLFLLIPSCIFMFWISLDYVQASWAVFEGSREAGGLPGVFLLKTLIPIMALLLLLQGLAHLMILWPQVTHSKPSPNSKPERNEHE